MPPVCSKCWEVACPKSSDGTVNCRKQPLVSVAAVANPDGTFVGLDFLSPIGATLRDGNVASLAGIATGSSRPQTTLTTEETALNSEAAVAAATQRDMPDLLSLASKRKELMPHIKNKMARLVHAEGDKDRRDMLRDFWTALRDEESMSMQRAVITDKPRSQQDFLEHNNPRLGLFNSGGKQIQKHGLTNLVVIENTYFDPETGKSMQKVEHSITFKNVLQLYRAWEIFVIIMCRLGFGTYGGWDGLSAEVYTVCEIHGVSIAHKFITECLNALDTKRVDNPVVLLSTGRAYMYLNTLLASRDSSAHDPTPGKTKGAPVAEQCKRGPVTLLGEFASIIKRNGKTAPCYNYNNGTNCLYGVDDKRFTQHKGKCAFSHICEICGKDHPKSDCK